MRAFVDALNAARDLDALGGVVCEAALVQATSALDGLSCRVLRAMVHLREQGGYRALVIREREAASEPALPSTTAWSWLVETGAPLTVNVPGRRVVLQDGTVVTLPQARVFGSGVHLSLRGVTHVRAFPLRLRGEVMGMLAIEIAAPDRVFDLTAVLLPDEPFQLLADIASPFLASAPSPKVQAPSSEGLPIVGRAMSERLGLMRVFAELDETVLLRGPVGSGKSRLARWVHDRSPRAAAPFVVAQVQGLPRDLLMGELFGHKGGVFAGAQKDREGLVQAAEGGTLFLDEIDKLSLEAQAVLLELLETRTWRRLGDNTLHSSELRFIVAANSDLEARVAEGSFLEDLFSRIDVLPVHIPGLDERQDEIAAWARQMLLDLDGPPLSAEAALALERGHYPQNLRQLRAIVTRCYAYARASKSSQVQEEHVRRAFSSGRARRAEADSVQELASALAQQCCTRGPPPADLGKALLGAVIEEAAAQGDLAAAFVAVGLEAAVRHRNHRRRHEEHLKELEALRVWLREP